MDAREFWELGWKEEVGTKAATESTGTDCVLSAKKNGATAIRAKLDTQ